MSLVIKEIETTGETLNLGAAFDHAEFLAKVNTEITVATGEAVDRAMSYADRSVTDLMARVKTELQGFAKPKERIMAVEVDGIKRKLSMPANPHLGRILIQAKLGLNTMLVGPAGCGKTTAARQVAESMGLAFSYVCLTAGASETWLFGRQTPNGFIPGAFYERYKHGGVFLADEYDAADANLLLSINTPIDMDQFYNPINGEMVKRHPDFVFIAGCNTFAKGADATYTGRNKQDGSALDRFAGCVIVMDYDATIEEQLCPDQALRERLQTARKNLREARSNEIVSARALKNAYLLTQNGIPLADVLESITASWSEETTRLAGLEEAKAKSKKAKSETSEHIPF